MFLSLLTAHRLTIYTTRATSTGGSFDKCPCAVVALQADFDAHYKNMPFLAIAYEQDKVKRQLAGRFKVIATQTHTHAKPLTPSTSQVTGAPSLTIVDGDGSTIVEDVVSDIVADPEGADFPWKPKTVLEILDDTTALVNNDGSASSTSMADVRKLDCLGIYFSAHWCKPCRGFTPKLAKVYEKLVGSGGKQLEILFASSDKSAAQFSEYLAEMPWKALPYSDRTRQAALAKECGVKGIPCLVFIDPKTGAVLTKKGVAAIRGDPSGSAFPWADKPVMEVDGDINEGPALVYLFDDVDDFEDADATKEALDEVAEGFIKGWAKEGKPRQLAFMYGDDDTDFVMPLRKFTGLNRYPSPAVFIVDIPSQAKYMWPGKGFPDAPQLRSFVEGYLAGKAAGMPIAKPPSVGAK